MSAREAWEIVYDVAEGSGSAIDKSREMHKWVRACAIVEALVEAHEKACIHIDHLDGGTAKTAGWSFRAFEKVRALERGEGASK